jgi:hypothetical protein
MPKMTFTKSVSNVDLLLLNLSQSMRTPAVARGCLAIAFFVLSGASLCRGQGTFTAASCNRSDVNSVINGPTHTAVNGDTIIIPAGSCTWTSGITISGKGIDITGTGTPNTGGGTFGAGTANTTITQNFTTSLFAFTNLTYGETAKVELLNLGANTGLGMNAIAPGPISFSGTCTSSGCPQIRVDNINFVANTWGNTAADGELIAEDGMFGVIDHNTVNESPSDGTGPPLVDVSNSAWQGVGANGDNSFATADTFGTAQQLYIENNSTYGIRLSDNDVPAIGGGLGGARWTCRFNVILQLNGSGVCSAHGTGRDFRSRGQRQLEAYYNSITANYAANVGFGIASGTGYFFSNSYTAPSFNASVAATSFRAPAVSDGLSPFFNCDGTEPWDQSPWTTTTECMDQPGTGAGLLLENATPVLASAPSTPCSTAGQCWTQNAIDPIYEAGDTGSTLNAGINPSDATRLAGYYYGYVSKTAQTSATSPFNGTTGTGYGTLARRPTTCTPTVGYWATDTGTWNTYNSQQGTLYLCKTTNTWTASYTPYTYPHPLTTGGTVGTGDPPPSPPTNLEATVQ